MKKNTTIYWLLTGAISAFILFSAWYSGTHKEEFDHRLGFPEYFRIELTVAKIIGAIVLLIPQTPPRVRQWVYVNFGVCLISAFIAKWNSGYPVSALAEPVFTFTLMLIAIYYLDKLNLLHPTKNPQ
jgi:hypothetical protein